MLTELLNTLAQFAEFLWPFRVVHQWKLGIFIFCGRATRIGLKPGIYPVVPWFMDVDQVTVAWDYVESGRLDISLKDGRSLSCEVIAKMRVADVGKAWIDFHDYQKDRRLMLRAAVAETLTEADPERFEPERRGRLLGGSLLKAVQSGGAPIGLEIESVQVTTFILQPKVVRLLTDQAAIVSSET